MASRPFIEVRSIDYVPLAERHGRVQDLWAVWFAGDANLATLAAGVLGIALGGSLLWMTLAVVGGCALGTFFMAFHSTQGPQLGLPQLIQSRPQFGYLGAVLVWIVALIAYVGYNAFNGVLAAQAVHQLLGRHSLADAPTIVIFSLIALALATVGYDWIHGAQRFIAYLLLVLLTLFTMGLIARVQLPPALLKAGPFKTAPFLVQFFSAAAYQLSWSIYVSDYSRYLPPNVGVRASFLWTYLGALVGGVWMMLVGTVAAALFPQADVAAAMQSAADAVWPGFGRILLTGALFGLFAITALNFYGASLSLLSIADCFGLRRPGISGRVVALLLAAATSVGISILSSKHFVDSFADLLAVLLYLLTPWTAINLVDFYWVRKSCYSVREIFNPHGIYGQWNWRGLLAYGGGFVAMIPFFSTGLYTGPVARAYGGADLAMLVGLPVSSLIYLWCCRSLDTVGERAAVERADRGLESAAAGDSPRSQHA